jgi:hypothetical protein
MQSAQQAGPTGSRSSMSAPAGGAAAYLLASTLELADFVPGPREEGRMQNKAYTEVPP